MLSLSSTTATEEAKKKKKNSSEFLLTTSFSSLPYDITLNVLARISRTHRPTLSLVSKSFRSLVASPELEATRSLIGITENCFYVCFNSYPNPNPNPRWFTFRQIPKPSSIPIPLFPYQYPKSPNLVPMGSEIYIIGGFINSVRSKEVFLLDCRSHQWRKLQEMLVPRGNSAAGVFEGKIYVAGGCESDNGEDRGEIYDPKTQTWKPFPSFLVPSDLKIDASKVGTKFCLVLKEKIICKTSTIRGKVMWCDLKEKSAWREIKGLRFPARAVFISLANSDDNEGGRRRLSVWWCLVYDLDSKMEIWCAKFSVERRDVEEVWGK